MDKTQYKQIYKDRQKDDEIEMEMEVTLKFRDRYGAQRQCMYTVTSLVKGGEMDGYDYLQNDIENNEARTPVLLYHEGTDKSERTTTLEPPHEMKPFHEVRPTKRKKKGKMGRIPKYYVEVLRIGSIFPKMRYSYKYDKYVHGREIPVKVFCYGPSQSTPGRFTVTEKEVQDLAYIAVQTWPG